MAVLHNSLGFLIQRLSMSLVCARVLVWVEVGMSGVVVSAIELVVKTVSDSCVCFEECWISWILRL